MQLNILYLFPEVLNLNGDRGNITVLKKRCSLRGIEANVLSCSLADEIPLRSADIIYLGGGSDNDLPKVCEKLATQKEVLLSYRDDGGVLLAVASGYPLLGHSYPLRGTTYPGLALLDITTEEGNSKLTGNASVNTPLGILTGFENHTGKTRLGKLATPLGKVLSGYGNNAEDGMEGAVYKNFYGTYLTGPILPANPELADLLIAKAVERKYGTFPDFEPLPNQIENLAKGYILNYGNRTHKR